MRCPLLIALATAAPFGALLGCGDANDHVASGGTLESTAAIPALPGPIEHCAPDGGATWTDLYADCFGPDHAGCGQSNCHADPAHGGGSVWVCGNDAHDCYTGMVGTIVLPQDKAKPEDSQMVRILRTEPGCPSCMPLGGSFVFAPADVDRIRTWIAAGAPEN